jgi:hypothetical protein
MHDHQSDDRLPANRNRGNHSPVQEHVLPSFEETRMSGRCAIRAGAFHIDIFDIIAELERAKGIEPSYAAWEAAVLPLNYARGRLISLI